MEAVPAVAYAGLPIPTGLSSPLRGTVKSVGSKYGFILTSSGEEAIFSPSENPLLAGLRTGDAVEFSVQHTNRGKRAFGVARVRHSGHVKSYNPAKMGFIVSAAFPGDALFRPEDVQPGQILQPGDAVEFDLKSTAKGKHAQGVGKVGFDHTFLFGPVAQGAIIEAPFSAGNPSMVPSVDTGLSFPSMASTSMTPQVPFHLSESYGNIAMPAQDPVQPNPEANAGREYGVVKSYNAANGYGFVVLSSTGEEAIVLRDSLPVGTVLTSGENVECTVVATPKGKRVTEVSVVRAVQTSAAALVLAAAAESTAVPSGAVAGGDGLGAAVTAMAVGEECGTVKSFNAEKGYGFIFTSQGEEALVKRESLLDAGTLSPAEQVVFHLVSTSKGKRAVNVRKVAAQRYQPY